MHALQTAFAFHISESNLPDKLHSNFHQKYFAVFFNTGDKHTLLVYTVFLFLYKNTQFDTVSHGASHLSAFLCERAGHQYLQVETVYYAVHLWWNNCMNITHS